jgi:Ribosomal S13/S15 N-terminal domain
VPSWLKLNADDVKEQIKKLGKKGMTPSQIGKLSLDVEKNYSTGSHMKIVQFFKVSFSEIHTESLKCDLSTEIRS